MTKPVRIIQCENPIKHIICDMCPDEVNNPINKNLYIKHKQIFIVQSKKYERKKLLLNKLQHMKLDYVSGTVCDGYIQHGIPDIDTVIKTLMDNQNTKNNRMYKLLNKLRKKQLEYDETVPAYKKYLKKGGDLNKVIINGELEKVLMKETDYLSLLNIADSDTAKDISLSAYDGDNDIVNNYVSNKNTIKFE
jgi:hypothetical protein